MVGERLPGAPADERVVCHVDVDCFYAACERLREPALRGEPVVVGMGYEADEPHGAVATASYEAREFGVESAMAITEALEKLPRKVEAASDPDLDVEEAGFYRPVDLDYYEEVAAEVKEILHDRADVVREVSVDEAYLDVTDRVHWERDGGSESTGEGDEGSGPGSDGTSGPGSDEASGQGGDGTTDVRTFASDLKAEIYDEVGIVVSVGVAPTMSAAKIASDHDKPDGLVVIEPGEVSEFLAPLPVDEIHNVGPVTAREMRDMGIETAGDLAAADPEQLRDRFGERGLEVRRFARGEDSREVTPVGRPKSLSRESAFTDPTNDGERMRERVRGLAADVAERAERKDAHYRTIGIKVVTPPFDVNTRAESLPGPVQDADLLEETALSLLAEFDDERVRKLGVRVSNLSFTDGEQASLAGFDGAPSTNASDRSRSGMSANDASPGESDGEESDDEEAEADSESLPPDGQTSLSQYE